MKKQDYCNHVKRHPLYHYFIVPGSLVLIVATAVNAVQHLSLTSMVLLIMSLFIHLLAFITRTYAKQNQDRIIRLELRLRYFQLTNKNLEEKETWLSMPQLLAIRFASDDEFLNFLDTEGSKETDGQIIKKQIKNWKPDNLRV